jgi:hypothetical protein
VCEPDKPRMMEVTDPDRDLSVDRPFLLRPGEAEQSSVADSAAQTAETA